MNTLSDFIKEQRRALRLTQKELADRAGVGLRFIRELESDKPTLRMDKVNTVLDLFGHRLGPVPFRLEADTRGARHGTPS
jgi:y4mF family transcriptional regulator